MFVSVRRYQDVASLAALVREIEMEFVPRLKRMPGFIAYYAVEEGEAVLTTISVFSTPEMAEESNAAAAAWMRERDPAQPLVPSEFASGRLAVVEPAIRG